MPVAFKVSITLATMFVGSLWAVGLTGVELSIGAGLAFLAGGLVISTLIWVVGTYEQ